ncbi:MAG: hypothetical protein FGM57_03800 [Candidatus Taylorbacteria bacterium]|nr:hypothetical protein [Candidatus Taylorbacteria bacterium]
MKEKIKSLIERHVLLWRKMPRNTKIISLLLIISLVGGISYVFADEGHEETAEIQPVQSEKVIVRTVGDVDPDGISQEGLNSFYGEVTSNDIGTVYTPREGVISSWNVSIGDAVTVGKVLGYVTVTSLSLDQQQALAEQQAAAFKARLDLETAKQISEKTKGVFGEIGDRIRGLADKQKSLFSGSSSVGSTTFATELTVLEANKSLLESKVQDFARTSLIEIYQIVGQNPAGLFADYSLQSPLSLKSVIGQGNNTLRTEYSNNLQSYAKKVKERKVTTLEVQKFLDDSVAVLSASLGSSQGQEYLDAELKIDIARLSEIQDSFRDLSNELAQATVDRSSKERERLQVDVDASKQIAELDNNYSLQILEQDKANQVAQNEAQAAELLANKLATVSSGVVPIVASRNGIIGTIEKNVGVYVTASDRIALISNINPTKLVRFTIPASWKDIKKGDTLSVNWKSEFGNVEGTLTGISTLLDAKGGYQAEVLLPKDAAFPVGASVRLIPNSSKKGIFVNRKAVVFEGINPSVWIVTEENILRKQPVTPGRQLGEYVEITSGMEKGFKYLVLLDPTLVLETGMKLDALIKAESTVEKSSPSASPSNVQDESQPHDH